MLQDRAVGFRRNCTLLLNTATGFSARVSWIEFSDAISGLRACAYVCHIFDSCILQLDAGWKDFSRPQVIAQEARLEAGAETER